VARMVPCAAACVKNRTMLHGCNHRLSFGSQRERPCKASALVRGEATPSNVQIQDWVVSSGGACPFRGDSRTRIATIAPGILRRRYVCDTCRQHGTLSVWGSALRVRRLAYAARWQRPDGSQPALRLEWPALGLGERQGAWNPGSMPASRLRRSSGPRYTWLRGKARCTVGGRVRSGGVLLARALRAMNQ
jgi:hypothetical protein